jgi:hypothetical protein
MSHEPADVYLDALLRKLERHYANRAAGLFQANGIPEPPRLPDPALPESSPKAAIPPRPPDPAISE